MVFAVGKHILLRGMAIGASYFFEDIVGEIFEYGCRRITFV